MIEINLSNIEIIELINKDLSIKDSFRTPEVRSISKKIYKKINDKSLNNILFLSEELLKQKNGNLV